MPKPPKMFLRGGTWYVRDQRDGKDRWVSLGTDHELAERRFKMVQQQGAQSVCRLNVSEAAHEWLQSYVRNRRNETGQKLAKRRVERYLMEFFKYRPLERVTREEMRRYRQWLEKRGIGRQTVVHILSDARCFLRWAEDAELIDRAPVPQRLIPRVPQSIPRALADGEVEALLRMPDPWRFVIRLWLATGVRWSEMRRLEAKHLTRDGWLQFEQQKTGKVVRVPLMETDPELAREISGRIGKLVPFKAKSSGAFNRTVKHQSGVSEFSSHRLRHTFATRWVQRGGSLVALQAILGHSDIELTQRYARLSDDFVRTEARRQAAGGRAVAIGSSRETDGRFDRE